MNPAPLLLAPDHPQRLALADEVHARPADAIEPPARATHVAVLIAPDEREGEARHLALLCESFGVAPPPAGRNHFSAALGGLTLRWERHGEFSGYTFTTPGLSPVPFSEPAVVLLPAGWLAAVPGRVMVATHAKVVAAAGAPADLTALAGHFGGNVVVGGLVGDGVGAAATDFRIHADGFSRFVLLDAGFTARQAGRMLQRLFEIETYRMMALLALPVARDLAERLVGIEAAVAALTTDIAADGGDDEALLHQVTALAGEVERALAASQFRFNACSAYAGLVATRIGELRERRLAGTQPIGEFMARRFTPAVATCEMTAQRLHRLSERVARAGALLATRVDIAREGQNQKLLESMDRRARLQLRLQQTVEGLSVAAIVYYAAGIVAYVSKALKGIGVPFDTDLAVGASIPVLALLVIAATRRARRHLGGDDRH